MLLDNYPFHQLFFFCLDTKETKNQGFKTMLRFDFPPAKCERVISLPCRELPVLTKQAVRLNLLGFEANHPNDSEYKIRSF
jgi:hypothetical protein